VATTRAKQAQGASHERRKTNRYSLLLPATIRTTSQQSWTARSKDVSARGAYLFVESDDDLFPGTDLELTLTLTFPEDIAGGSEVLVAAHGKVIRVDKSAGRGTGQMGLAVAFQTYDFMRSESLRGLNESRESKRQRPH